MISVSINNPSTGILKVKDSDGYVIYINKNFRYIDHLIDLDPDLYLIHLKIASKNYYEILQLEKDDSQIEVKMNFGDDGSPPLVESIH